MVVGLLLLLPLLANARNVQIRNGEIRGLEPTNGVEKYLGVPFATPPVGALRFKPPQKSPTWRGIMNATVLPPSCWQSGIQMKLYNTELSEDCLYLNVYVPENIPEGEKLAVMVWFHGGGYTQGTASTYDASPLVKDGNVIVVAANYRLAVLGFLYQPNKVSALGIMDQQLALRWVQENIAAFGGDPDSVTIFGESAGGGSVAHHLMSPKSKGLFHRAIPQSGTCNAFWGSNAVGKAKLAAQDIASKVNCTNTLGEVDYDCLMETPAQVLAQVVGMHFLAPLPDGDVIPHYANDLNGPVGSDVPVLMGFTDAEGVMFSRMFWPAMPQLSANFTDWSFAADKELLRDGFGSSLMLLFGPTANTQLLVDTGFYEYLRGVTDPRARIGAMYDFSSDIWFRASGIDFANKLTEGSSKVYLYEYAHRTSFPVFGMPSDFGSVHGAEIVNHFDIERGGTVRIALEQFPKRHELPRSEQILSKRMIKYWTDFAKTGNPGDDFPEYSKENREFARISTNATTAETNYLGEKYSFWSELVPRLMKYHVSCRTVAEIKAFIRANGILKNGCTDFDVDCPGFAIDGECAKNPDWTLVNCPRSCGICSVNVENRVRDINDGFGQWSGWSICPCSTGSTRTQSRQRPCLNSDGICPGKWHDERPCQCEAAVRQQQQQPWGTWSQWGPCTATCGTEGCQERTRQCPGYGGCRVRLSTTEKRPCVPEPPSCSQWAQWESWSPCLYTCSQGQELSQCYRSRTCYPQPGQCFGQAQETQICCENLPQCAQWSQWGPWSQCPYTCSEIGQLGQCQRSRTCFPTNGQCFGQSQETQPCCQNLQECAVWSQWGPWSQCPYTCSDNGQFGQCQRSRTCFPADGQCFGQSQESQICCQNLPQCAIWSDWGSWSQCPYSCGTGTAAQCIRSRSCFPPGGQCFGQPQESQQCCFDLPPCAQWSAWGPWSQPQFTCSSGAASSTCSRTRACVPAGQCGGQSLETRQCAPTNTCPYWSQWSNWSACSNTCGYGTRRRLRQCPVGGCVGPPTGVTACQQVNPCGYGYVNRG